MPALQRLHALAGHLSTSAAMPPRTTAPVGSVGSGMAVASVEAKHVLRAGGTCLVFVKIVTDNGVVGWGEATNSGRNLATAEAVMEAARHLEGKDPFEIERHWQQIYRGTFRRGGPILCSALAGIEMALWDIKGKALGVPVYELLGGKVREKVRCYAHCGAPGAPHLDPYTPAEERRKALETFDAAEWAKGLNVTVNGVGGIHPRDSPFSAFKVNIIGGMDMVERPIVYRRAIEMFAAIRAEIGDSADIATDFHGRATPMISKILCKGLEPYFPMFVEEAMWGQDGAYPDEKLELTVPLRLSFAHDLNVSAQEGASSWRELSNSTTCPLATGERLYARWQFQDYISTRAVQIVQPDLIQAGGIWESRKIAAMAESKSIGVAPHCPFGPIALAASLHLDAAIPNFLIQEQTAMGDGMLVTPFRVDDGGYISVEQFAKPGLGIEIDEDALEGLLFDGFEPREAGKGPPREKMYQMEDGSVAEW